MAAKRRTNWLTEEIADFPASCPSREQLLSFHPSVPIQVETAYLANNDTEFRWFVYLLGAERILAAGGNHLDALLVESKKVGRALTNEYYGEYPPCFSS